MSPRWAATLLLVPAVAWAHSPAAAGRAIGLWVLVALVGAAAVAAIDRARRPPELARSWSTTLTIFAIALLGFSAAGCIFVPTFYELLGG